MNPAPQQSFIPRQQPGVSIPTPPRRGKRRVNVLSLFAVVVFFGSLILSIGVFSLKQIHERTLSQRQEELRQQQTLFNTDDIQSAQLLDARIRVAEHLLDSHVSPSKLFSVLESTTQEEVQYTNFTFTRRPSGSISVSMEGVAPRFNTVARQAQRYADETLFRRVVFANLDKVTTESVKFSVDVDIARDSIAYAATPIPTFDTTSLFDTPDGADENTNSLDVTDQQF